MASDVALAAEKIRRQRLVIASPIVFVETNRFRLQDPQHTALRCGLLQTAPAETIRLIAATRHAVAFLWRPKFRHKKVGVAFPELGAVTSLQGDLWVPPDKATTQRLTRAIDRLNGRYGRDTVDVGGSDRKRAWTLRRELLSPQFTTRWEDFMRVWPIRRLRQRAITLTKSGALVSFK